MQWLELVKALFLGIIEGITEWLPISSTGHMIIFDDLVHLNVSPDFWSVFLVVIQLGAIMAVIVLYFQRLNPWSRLKSIPERHDTWLLWAKIIVACLPAAILGFLFDNWIEAHFFNSYIVALALIVYGVAFILVERWQASKQAGAPIGRHSASLSQPTGLDSAASEKIGFGRAFAIGCFQCLAIIPGTSRSGSTILGARILGVNRRTAAEFSFFLAIPVMLGASAFKVVKAFVGGNLAMTTTEWGVFGVGIVVAFIVSIFAIRFLMAFIQKHSFSAFGWYRIALGVVVLAYFLLR